MTDISVFKMSQKAYTDKYEDVIYKNRLWNLILRDTDTNGNQDQ